MFFNWGFLKLKLQSLILKMGLSDDLRWGEPPSRAQEKVLNETQGLVLGFFSPSANLACTKPSVHFSGLGCHQMTSGPESTLQHKHPSRCSAAPAHTWTPRGPWEFATCQQPDRTLGTASLSLCRENALTSLQARPGITLFCPAFRASVPDQATRWPWGRSTPAPTRFSVPSPDNGWHPKSGTQETG